MKILEFIILRNQYIYHLIIIIFRLIIANMQEIHSNAIFPSIQKLQLLYNLPNFVACYIYNTNVITCGIDYLHEIPEEYDEFINSITLSPNNRIGFRLIADQNEKFGHNGYSASQTIVIIKYILTNGVEENNYLFH